MLKHDVKSLPKWAQRHIAGLESRSRAAHMRAALEDAHSLIADVAASPWPTTWPKTRRLYIAAVPFDFEQRLKDFIERHQEKQS